jgi:hypothetical protein
MPVSVSVSRSVSIGFYATFLVMFLLCVFGPSSINLMYPGMNFGIPFWRPWGYPTGRIPKRRPSPTNNLCQSVTQPWPEWTHSRIQNANDFALQGLAGWLAGWQAGLLTGWLAGCLRDGLKVLWARRPIHIPDVLQTLLLLDVWLAAVAWPWTAWLSCLWPWLAGLLPAWRARWPA